MSLNDKQDVNNPGMSDEQRQNIKKYLVFTAMGLLCAAFLYFIFAPSAEDRAKTEATQGLNADIPMPKDEVIINDKRDAYEQEQIKQRQDERMRTLHDFSALLGETKTETDDDIALLPDDVATQRASVVSGSQNRSQTSTNHSVQAYNDINRSLGSFYEKPREDTEKERLREEVEELKMRIDERENRKSAVDEQIELLERSFQMASKYMPETAGATGTNVMAGTNAVATPASTTASVSEKTAVVHVDRVSERTVSAILPEISNAEFINMYSKPRNMGFRTVTDNANQGVKNTFSACIHSDQTIMDGQNVRLRLLEAVQVGNIVIPQNTAVTGVAKIQGERLGISVVSLEHAGTVIPVELRAYDLDGQQGIFIPNMAELSAVKEIVANMGTSAGTSINLSTDAGKQFAADMGRNAIQGVSQFTAKKLREVKVHLKADYRIFLLPKEN